MLKAGAACLDISPPLGTLIPGLFHERRAETVHDPLNVRAFVLEGDDGAIAVAVCDLIGVKRPYLDRARSRAAEATGLSPERILVCCTHTHTGAQTGDDPYTEFVIGRIADAIREAWQKRTGSVVGWGVGNEDRAVFNRRYRMKDGSVRTNPGIGNPEVASVAGPIDPDVGVLALETPQGDPIGLLANYALHYVGGGDHERAVSADYFGCFSRLMRNMRGGDFVAALSNGACGDINNHDVLGGETFANDRYQHTERVAARVAAEALWVWNGMTLSDEAPLGGKMQELTLEHKSPPSEEDIARAKEIEGKSGGTMADRAFARRTLRRLDEAGERTSTWVQALRVGDLALVGVPGELLVRLGMDIKRRSPFAQTTVLELANDSVGYLPDQEAFGEGGYEPEACQFAAGAGEMIVDTAVALLDAIHRNET